MGFIVQLLLTAGALWLSTVIVPDIDVSGSGAFANFMTLLVVALIFGLVNALIKPIVQIFGCAFYILTLGLFALVVNALMFWLTGWLADKINLPFHVGGFWAAFWGAIIVTVVSWIVGAFLPRKAED
ncbi:phage holin family protein [Phytomonospora endophytica]|uniref:Putative membrane protein n=1 Tax=Phytomonospora endophytica TaxID=714109 RepID=A0A841FT32_9ACTN|nr:phage holin family protein [Phytomonospora endophytica]MBB6039455.1 putative membrane protein [Phytomonospora endophytica]GIG70182.1 hypothetical protein Pen01_64770 [Phytomonospora endophytica]